MAAKNATGYLTGSRWTRAGGDANLARGEAMFRGQCMACHTADAYRSMKRLLAGRNHEAIGNLLAMLHEYKPESPYRAFIPPLVGTQGEIEALGDFLTTLVPTAKVVANVTEGKTAAVPK